VGARNDARQSGGNGTAPPSEGDTTIREVLERIDAAVAGMSERNPNRILLAQCRVAIVFLAQRVPDQALVTRSGIILP
jgi:hypothetical protein